MDNAQLREEWRDNVEELENELAGLREVNRAIIQAGNAFFEAAWDAVKESIGMDECLISDTDRSDWACAMREFTARSDLFRAALAKVEGERRDD